MENSDMLPQKSIQQNTTSYISLTILSSLLGQFKWTWLSFLYKWLTIGM